MNSNQAFIKKDYDLYDRYKFFFIDYLKSKGWSASINKDKYGVDIIGIKNNIKYLIEIEVKKKVCFSSKETYPYETVHFLNRKQKFNTSNFLYVIISFDRKYFLYSTGNAIFRKENKIQKPCSRNGNKDSEYFYSIPKNRVIFKKFA